jgi:hypothetical protein
MSTVVTDQRGNPIPTITEAEERERLEAARNAQIAVEQDAARRAAMAQMAREREVREAEKAEHDSALASWRSERDRLYRELGVAESHPLLAQLAEANARVSAAQARIVAHEGTKP